MIKMPARGGTQGTQRALSFSFPRRAARTKEFKKTCFWWMPICLPFKGTRGVQSVPVSSLRWERCAAAPAGVALRVAGDVSPGLLIRPHGWHMRKLQIAPAASVLEKKKNLLEHARLPMPCRVL